MTLTVEQQRIVEENLGLVRAVLSRCVSSPGSTGIYSELSDKFPHLVSAG